MVSTLPERAAGPTRRRFTVEEYYRMVTAGILHEDDRIELIDGEIIAMAAIGIRHAEAVTVLTELAMDAVGTSIRIRVQNPLDLGSGSQPEPDLALVAPRRYRGRHPSAADTSLVIEVADTSLDFDRNTKLPLYAAAGIPEAWLVNLNGRSIERHSAPQRERYSQILIAGPGETLASTILPDFAVPVDEVLGGGQDEPAR